MSEKRSPTRATLEHHRFNDQLDTLVNRIKSMTWSVSQDHHSYMRADRQRPLAETERDMVRACAYLDAYMVMTNYQDSAELQLLTRFVTNSVEYVSDMRRTPYSQISKG